MTIKFNKRFRSSLCALDIFSHYLWVIPLKDKKGNTITNAFETILNESNQTPYNRCVDKDSKSYNRSKKL